MNITDIPCRRSNYGSVRSCGVQYLVIHYTAGHNDTARDNGKYFAREHVGASAHYFVDEGEIVRSVPEEYVAWHCGGNYYRHPGCRNANSIGIEICTKEKNGTCWFAPEAMRLAKELVRSLMERYEVPAENVLRHYDVTGKICPAPFVGQGQTAWEQWKGGLRMYQSVEQVPDWAKETVERLVGRNLLTGDGENLNLSYDLVRVLVILDRAGIFGKEKNNGEIE